MIAVSKIVYIDNLNEISYKYNNTHCRKIKKKAAEGQPVTYFDYDVENNDKDRKFKVGDHRKISKYKNIFPKSCTQD